jgi:hypothetical protein
VRWLITAVALIVVSVVLDLVLLRGHGEAEWTYFPGFYSLFGLIGAIVIIAVSRLLGKFWLERDEDYYTSKKDDE